MFALVFLPIAFFVTKFRKDRLNKCGVKIFGEHNFTVLPASSWLPYHSKFHLVSLDGLELLVSEFYGGRRAGPASSLFAIGIPSIRGFSISRKNWLNRGFYTSNWPTTLAKNFDSSFWLDLHDPNESGEFLQRPEFIAILERLKNINTFCSLWDSEVFDRVKDAGGKWDRLLTLKLYGILSKHDKHEVVDVVCSILRDLSKSYGRT